MIYSFRPSTNISIRPHTILKTVLWVTLYSIHLWVPPSISSTGDKQENGEREITCWGKRGRGGGARSRFVRPQESLALYKSFNTLWYWRETARIRVTTTIGVGFIYVLENWRKRIRYLLQVPNSDILTAIDCFAFRCESKFWYQLLFLNKCNWLL
jgi:hypothetical protein